MLPAGLHRVSLRQCSGVSAEHICLELSGVFGVTLHFMPTVAPPIIILAGLIGACWALMPCIFQVTLRARAEVCQALRLWVCMGFQDLVAGCEVLNVRPGTEDLVLLHWPARLANLAGPIWQFWHDIQSV